MKRRAFLNLTVATAVLIAGAGSVCVQSAVKEVRIGYQKTGVLVITR